MIDINRKDNAKNENIKKLTLDDVTGIDLMTKEQFAKVRDIVPEVEVSWWLKDPGTIKNKYANNVLFVGGENELEPNCVDEIGMNADFKCGVRPILYLEGFIDLSVGQKVEVFQREWTAIDSHTVLSDTVIAKEAFREGKHNNARRYEFSDVKKWLEYWLNSEEKEYIECEAPRFLSVFDTCDKMIHSTDGLQLIVDDIIIEDISLLSEEQFNQYSEVIKPFKQEFTWLSTEDTENPYRACAIDYDNGPFRGDIVSAFGAAVRPILIIKINDEEEVKWKTEERNGKTVQMIDLFGLPWTRLDETILLCDTLIARRTYYNKFDPEKKNSFLQSDLRCDFLYPWLIERYLLHFIKKENVSLLSYEEYVKATNEERIPVHFRDAWWRLRSKGTENGLIVAVRKRFVLLQGARSDWHEDVRPMIRLKNDCVKIPIRGKIRLFGFEFTAIDDHLLLCDKNIGQDGEQMRFHKNYSELVGDFDWFEISDIKHYIQDEWFEANLQKMHEADRKRIEDTQSGVKEVRRDLAGNNEGADQNNREWGDERVEIAPGIYYYRQFRRIARENPHDEKNAYQVSENDTKIIETMVEERGRPTLFQNLNEVDRFNLNRRIYDIRQGLMEKNLESKSESNYSLLKNIRRHGYYFSFEENKDKVIE